MTIEMIDKWVTSFRFNGEKRKKEKKKEKKKGGGGGFNRFFPSVGFPGSDVSQESQCGCHLRFFSNLCMRVVDKKVNYAGLLCYREL